MSKKDFIAIASIVSGLSNDGSRSFAANAFANYLATVNPRFDRTRFFAACNCDDCHWPGAAG